MTIKCINRFIKRFIKNIIIKNIIITKSIIVIIINSVIKIIMTGVELVKVILIKTIVENASRRPVETVMAYIFNTFCSY